MNDCDWCGKAANLCICVRIGLEHCGICTHANGRSNLTWVGMPNPAGAWRGEVFSHWKCKDEKACAGRCASVDRNEEEAARQSQCPRQEGK